MERKKKLQSAADLMQAKIAEYTLNAEKPNYVSQEFQDYGYRLAMRLDDPTRKALYIKLTKSLPRALIEDAAAFATDYPHAKNKGKLFMWKLHELIGEYKLTHPEFNFGERKKKPKKKPKNSSQIPLTQLIM